MLFAISHNQAFSYHDGDHLRDVIALGSSMELSKDPGGPASGKQRLKLEWFNKEREGSCKEPL